MQMATGIGAEEVQRGVGGVHDGLIAAAGRLLAPMPATPAGPATPDNPGADPTPAPPEANVYGGAGVPSPGKASETHPQPPQPPPYPGTNGGSPYGVPIAAGGAAPPPLIGPGANGAPRGAVPPPPAGAGGLSTGAGQAGEDYNTSGTQVQGLDERLTQEINDAVSQNQQARDKITSILSEMKTYQAGVVGSGDPLALSNYQKYLDEKLASVQQVLDEAHVNATTKQQILKGIAAEYKASGPAAPAPAAAATPKNGEESQASGSEAGAAEVSGSGDGSSAGADGALDDSGVVAGQGAGSQGLIDPFAGLGPMNGMNPMMGAGLGDALGALGGLGGLGGSLGSSLAGLGAAPLSALGPALGSLGGLGQLGGPGFTDQPAAAAKDAAAFKDDKPADPAAAKDPSTAPKDSTELTADKPADSGKADKPLAAEAGFKDDGAGQGSQGSGAEQAARETAEGDPGKAGAPAAAAPASAPGAAAPPPDAGKLVTLPDGTPVTAPSEQAANATRAVLAGQSVTDAYKEQGIDIPPPGAPVTTPVDPSHLQPGDIARFGSRPPVMALGNGKVWMDGQVQPLSAMGSSGDFLGWSKPAAPAVTAHAVTPLAPPPPAVPSVTIPPGPSQPS